MRSLGVWFMVCSAVFALSGCGSSDGGAEEKAIIHTNLASMSDDVAEFLEAGDVCGAPGYATELLNYVSGELDGGNVPSGLASELNAATADLTSRTDALEREADCSPSIGNTPALRAEPMPSGKPVPADRRMRTAERARNLADWIRENFRLG